MRYSRQKKSKSRQRAAGVLIVAIAVIAGWWYLRGPGRTVTPTVVELAHQSGPQPVDKPDELPTDVERSADDDLRLAADEEVLIPADDGQPDRATAGASGTAALHDADQEVGQQEHVGPREPAATQATNDTRSGNRGIADARRRIEAGKLIEARHILNAMLNRDLTENEAVEVRTLLKRLADDTIFSRKNTPNDPLTTTYAIEPGDRLISIGQQFDVPYEIVMEVNGISDPGKIRAGQQIKVPRGPFHAKIHKSRFRLDIYLRDLYVRSYRVGLGNGGGTPEGVWRVKNRLPNPTYYPPASATDKRIIPPDDPTNPLGERWIGLEGIEGEAQGREGYGIHGTIEPESIGKAVSLGCVRMHNEDVAFLYKLMLPGRSTVTILP